MFVLALPAMIFADGKKEKKGKAEYTILMNAQHEGITWFDDMRKGVEDLKPAYLEAFGIQY